MMGLPILPGRLSVKRLFIAIPLILFILLNACMSHDMNFTDAEWTTIAEKQTARMWTPTLIPTPMYGTERSALTRDLYSGIETAEVLNISDQLEHTIGVDYQIRDVKFLPENSIATLFEVDVNCVCVLDRYCCTTQRTFVVVMIAMSQNRLDVLNVVPTTVNSMKVMYFNPNGSSDGLSVQWNDVKNFLNDPNNGSQFIYKVTPEP
jgi:hypothetical protein